MQSSILRTVGFVALIVICFCASAQTEPLTPARIAPDEFKWSQTPAGTLRANLVGDDRTPGIYINRVRFPANYKVQPHFHPDERVVTVISGTLYVGYGDRFDESTMKALPAGSIWTEPAKQSHYAWAKDGEVTIQIFGANGPTGVTPIAPK